MLEHSIEEFKHGGTRAEQMKRVEAELFELYKNPDLDVKPEQLAKRGGAYYSEAACECINAIYNDGDYKHIFFKFKRNTVYIIIGSLGKT